MRLDDLETPCLVLDESRMERNIARMRSHLGQLGVQFRPHVKTCKSIDVAARMMESPTGPITVSTLKEAEYFFEHGVTDILYAVGISPNKIAHVLDLRRRGADVTAILDNLDAARFVGEQARAGRDALPVLIEIDADGHRSGIAPGDEAIGTIAHALRGGGAEVAGVMTHAGNSYNCHSTDEIRALAEQERRAVVDSAARLQEVGFSARIVSVGSTPTATFARDLTGVTEVRVGVFVFFDLFMAGLGVCRIDDIALSVMTSVIGHQRDKGWIIVDAGWMAMSRDRGTAHQTIDQRYGLVCDIDGVPLDDLIIIDANQEHGIVAHRSRDPKRTPELAVGTLLRILPNHACATGAQHDRYHVVRESREIKNVWPRFSGW